MVKKKRSIPGSPTAMYFEDDAIVTSTDDEVKTYASLVEVLKEISNLEGVTGYILRNQTNANIALQETEKATQYALLTLKIFDSNQTIAQIFDVGDVESTIIEGKNIKALCITIGENKISVFMRKTVDHDQIADRILH